MSPPPLPHVGILLVATAILAWSGTLMVIRKAGHLGLLQEPNQRSFHDNVTPHGGGLGLLIGIFPVVLLLFYSGALSGALSTIMLGAGGLIASVGLWDDIRPLPIAGRLCTHLVAVLMTLVLLTQAGDPAVFKLPPLLVSSALILALVWWLNLFNFMDGIDGLAGVETLSIVLSALLLLYSSHNQSEPLCRELMLCFALLGAATAGFLPLNWAPARVFMGDVGSTYLGFILGALALATLMAGWLPLSVWLILGGVFWVDGTYTLLRRIARAEAWHQAHRSHAYQRYAAQLCEMFTAAGLTPQRARARAHRRVSLAVALFNLLWLLPMAWLVIIEPIWTPAWLTLAWLPLLLLATRSQDCS